jgi:hypothetical protein
MASETYEKNVRNGGKKNEEKIRRQRAAKSVRGARALVPRSTEERMVFEKAVSGANVDVAEKALLYYARKGDGESVAVIRRSCEAGVAVDTVDEWGNTPLILASVYGNAEIVRTLLEFKANPNAQNKWAGTAIIESASRGFLDVVMCLVDHGANLNSQNKVGDTALAMAAYKAHVDVVLHLVEAGSDPAIRDTKGKTAVDRAKECGATASCSGPGSPGAVKRPSRFPS